MYESSSLWGADIRRRHVIAAFEMYAGFRRIYG